MTSVQIQEEFVTAFREIQISFSRLYVRVLTELDLTFPQYTVLNLLANFQGPLTMTEASSRLHITKPAVTHLVDQLEKRKCLKRVENKEDRRIYFLELLPKGHEAVCRTQSHVLHFLLSTLGRFKGAEQEIINRFYVSLSQTIEQELESGGVCGKKK